MSKQQTKQDVRAFYDSIGWSKESDGFYQNARYEDLRPVSSEYIHNCHLRVTPYFEKGGKYILDAGCGPIQYQEYLTYSEHFEKRVCADISITALKEARERIGDHGFFVVADVANLPFKKDCFDGVVSLHTLHHLDLADQKKAWYDIFRTMKPGAVAVIVNGWTESAFMKKWKSRMEAAEKLGHFVARLRGKEQQAEKKRKASKNADKAVGTFVTKMDADWIRRELHGLGDQAEITIRCWRSVSVRWLRALIHDPYGKAALRRLYRMEEEQSEYYGEIGQYPMVILTKKNQTESAE